MAVGFLLINLTMLTDAQHHAVPILCGLVVYMTYIHDIHLISRASAASEDSDDAAIPGEDDGPGITSIGKLATFLVIGQDNDLDGGVLNVVLGVAAGEGFETVSMTNGGPSGCAVLHDEETLATVSFKVLGVSDLLVWDDTKGLEETILGVLVVLLISGVRVHHVAEVSNGNVAACEGKTNNVQSKLKTMQHEKKTH